MTQQTFHQASGPDKRSVHGRGGTTLCESVWSFDQAKPFLFPVITVQFKINYIITKYTCLATTTPVCINMEAPGILQEGEFDAQEETGLF